MAKFECELTGDFDTWLNGLHEGILKGSIITVFREGSDCTIDGVRCAVRVYERNVNLYSRLSAHITLVGGENRLLLSIIVVGTMGEERFVEKIVKIVERGGTPDQRTLGERLAQWIDGE